MEQIQNLEIYYKNIKKHTYLRVFSKQVKQCLNIIPIPHTVSKNRQKIQMRTDQLILQRTLDLSQIFESRELSQPDTTLLLHLYVNLRLFYKNQKMTA